MSPRRLGLLVLLGAAGGAHGAAAGVPQGQPLPREADHHVSSAPTWIDTAAFDPDALPAAEIPPIASGTAPRALPDGPPPADLEVRTAAGRPIKSFHRGRAPLDVEIAGARGTHVGILAGRVSPSPRGIELRPSIPMKCEGTATPLVALRWERFAADPSGAATVEMATGWFDPAGCRAVAVARTTLHPAVIARSRGVPLLYAARAGHGLTFFLPQGSSFVVDAMGGEATTVTGENPRVTLPLTRGGSASFAATVEPWMLGTWKAGVEGNPPPPGPSEGGSIRFGVDVLQPVQEPRPTVLVRVEAAAANADPSKPAPVSDPGPTDLELD
ncbi:MAG TPA: hypothetical protein VKU41_19255 [Polyangiaceae bacterium]|nr:hypothetical protein [Polyangiaceae bacterium]